MSRYLKIAGLIAGSATVAVALAILVQPDPAHAALLDGIFNKDPAQIGRNDIIRVLVELIQYGLMFASAVAALFIVVNGYQYVLSAGNPEKIEKAKMGLTWSIGGLILVISSYAIVYLVAQTLGFTRDDLPNVSRLEANKPAGVPGSVPSILDSVANILFIFAGAVAVIFIILGGYRYITSQGNRELAEKAQKTLLYAVVGLIIVFAAFLIFNFIANRLEVTNQFS